MKHKILAFLGLGGFVCLFALQPAAATEIYVSPVGDDQASGENLSLDKGREGPVKSLERARDLARALRRHAPNEPVSIQLLPGVYRLAQPLVLGAADSGSPQALVTYAARTAGSVTLSGAEALKGGWIPAVDRHPDCGICKAHPQIQVHTLTATQLLGAGILSEDGFHRSQPAPYAEVVMGGQRMPLARWPNNTFATVDSVDNASNFSVTGAALPAGLASAPDLWARGYWKFNWADLSEPVRAVDPGLSHITLAKPALPYGIVKGGRFFLFNALALLDSPGEWYLDRRSGELYFWPPVGSNINDTELTLTSNLLQANGVSNVVFSGINFTGTTADAITAVNVIGLLLKNDHISVTGGWGVEIQGRDSGVDGCQLDQIGYGGINLTGGDRKTLTPSGLYAQSNTVHDYAQRVRSYVGGIAGNGVGITIRSNLISDAPHLAIFLVGNDHVVERNEITRVLLDAADSGALYMDHDWTARGTVIRYNYFHDLLGRDGREVKGVYLDDQTSGIEVSDNIFWNVKSAVFLSGGSDNLVTRNIFINTDPAIYLDNRGMTWEQKGVQDPAGAFQAELAAVPYDSSPVWRKRYPALPGIRQDGLGIPRRNKFVANQFLGSYPYLLRMDSQSALYQFMEKAVKQDVPNVLKQKTAPDFVTMCKMVRQVIGPVAACQ